MNGRYPELFCGIDVLSGQLLGDHVTSLALHISDTPNKQILIPYCKDLESILCLLVDGSETCFTISQDYHFARAIFGALLINDRFPLSSLRIWMTSTGIMKQLWSTGTYDSLYADV